MASESSVETDNIEQNHIVSILSKLGNIKPKITKDYEDFDMNAISSSTHMNINVPTEENLDKKDCVEIDYE